MGAVAEREAAELRARGFAVEVFTPAYSGRAQNSGAHYLRPWLAFGNAALVPQLIWQLWRCEVAHLHYPFYGADVFVWLWSKLRRRPYILTYHMRPATNDWRNLIFTLHRRLLEPWIVRGASTVMVSSLDYAATLGLKHVNLLELPFGVDEERFSPGRDDEFRQQHGLRRDATIFIFVGGLDAAHSFKGVDVLIRAASFLSADPAWQLLIVGDGDRRAGYELLAKTLGIAERVVFVGALSELDLPRAYRAADVHILPSVSQSEAFGLVTLEAAATGLPSIVSNLPGVRSLVVAGETGVVIEPGLEESLELAMLGFLRDPGLIERYGRQARARVVASYGRRKLAERLVGVYNGSIV